MLAIASNGPIILHGCFALVFGLLLAVFGSMIGRTIAVTQIRALKHLRPAETSSLFKGTLGWATIGGLGTAIQGTASGFQSVEYGFLFGGLVFVMYLAGIGAGYARSSNELKSVIESILKEDVRLLGAQKYFKEGNRRPSAAELFVFVTQYGRDEAAETFQLQDQELADKYDTGAELLAQLMESESDAVNHQLFIDAIGGMPLNDVARKYSLSSADVSGRLARMHNKIAQIERGLNGGPEAK